MKKKKVRNIISGLLFITILVSAYPISLVNNAWFCCSIDAWMKTCNEMNRIKDQHLLKRNALVLLHCYWGGYYEKRFEHLASKNH
jgi:hypothetical protein